jgi:hypothetical protein
MKLIAGLQIALGILAGYLICYIAVHTHHPIASSVVYPLAACYRIALIIAGGIIFCLALLQYFKHTRFAVWRLFCGLVIVSLSSLLYTDALSFAYISSVYLPTYLIMAAALAVIVIGVIQIFKIKET